MSRLNEIYTKKQIEILRKTWSQDWFILINHGAKRSGKTVLNNDLFLMELRRVRDIAKAEGVDEPMYILAGVSSKTIQNNILTELTNKYDIDFKFDKHGSFKMFGVKIIQAFTGTIGGLGGIRGMTAYGAYINEASLARREVFDEIVSRCSGRGARILCDTNPDNPEHWLKKEYIDNPTDRILSYKFTIFDNTFLDKRYLQSTIETTPSGMFTERNIYGNWVSGDGMVYKDFDSSKHFIDDLSPYNFKRYIAGVDWGYSHFGVIVVLGLTDDGRYIMIEEHAETGQEIDYWVDIAKGIKERYGNVPFYCDSARVEHIDRFIREGLSAYLGNKAVIAGIEELATMYKSNKLFIYEPVAKRFKEEIYSYVWSDKTGEDSVKKEFDDVQDAMRYAIYTDKHEGKIKTMKKKFLGL
nr:MAG TPA_asm: large terminase [Caudoviricetes sp.]